MIYGEKEVLTLGVCVQIKQSGGEQMEFYSICFYLVRYPCCDVDSHTC